MNGSLYGATMKIHPKSELGDAYPMFSAKVTWYTKYATTTTPCATQRKMPVQFRNACSGTMPMNVSPGKYVPNSHNWVQWSE